MLIKTIAFAVLLSTFGVVLAADWTGFRGDGSGVSKDAAPPSKFTETEHVAWKSSLPGKGLSSPIVVKDRVYVTASSGAKDDRLHILCYAAGDGKLAWERQYWATGRTLTHTSSAVAANTPVSDGETIFAFYSSNDLIAVDLDGNLKWFRGLAIDYPEAGNDVGMASSVAVVDGAVIVQSESQGDSFVMGIDAKTGETLWKLDRLKEANWTTPVVLTGKGAAKNLVLLTNKEGLSAHDPRTGREVWRNAKECDGIGSCVVADDFVYVPGGGTRAVKIPTGGEPEVVWSNAKLNSGAASPLVYEDRIYTINRAGVITAADIKTGESVWQLRLKGQFWATPVVVDDVMFVAGKEGNVQTIDLSDPKKGKLIGENKLPGEIYGTPAISQARSMFARTRHCGKSRSNRYR
ncbi:MAG: PQQ-binding-like beta-propeller repeat protein [Pirellulales bacterium]